ncbi:hypothetical protein [Methylocaldum gracile]|jgi:hypothetical protein|uniref:hypothetical protein n=1 Tax=Methylocaldum sp. 0917 TaxID=2485163 RepID=UPI00105D02AF
MSTNYREQNVTVGGSLTRIAQYDVEGAEVLAVQLTNKGAGALNAFELRGVGVKDSSQTAQTLKVSDFLTSDLHVLFASTDPGSLGANASALLYLNVATLKSIELWASAAGSAQILVGASGSAASPLIANLELAAAIRKGIGILAGERLPEAPDQSWLNHLSSAESVMLTGTSAVTIDGSSVANDKVLLGLVIFDDATAVTATIGGVQNQDYSEASLVFSGGTGTTLGYTVHDFSKFGIKNSFGPLKVTPSVTAKVLVLYARNK